CRAPPKKKCPQETCEKKEGGRYAATPGAVFFSGGCDCTGVIQYSNPQRSAATQRCTGERVRRTRSLFCGRDLLSMCLCSELIQCAEHRNQPNDYAKRSDCLSRSSVQLSV